MKHSMLRHAVLAASLAFFSFAAYGQNDPDAGIALDIDRVRQLAIRQQPMLDSLAASARSARESAVAARQLPDPQLFGGVRDLPIDGSDAGSFTRDSDTQLIAGLLQEFPRAEKRRLRSRQGELEADQLDASRSLTARTIERDASLAWLDAWQAEQESALVAESLREAEAQVAAVGIEVKVGKAPQSDLFAARVEVEMLRDRIAEKAQDGERARNALSRWIGEAAQRPLRPDLPEYPPLPPLDVVLARLRQQPQVGALDGLVTEARAATDLAKAAYLPDWRVELGYGNRARYSDMVMLQVGVDLPFFTRNRQDRELAAATARREAAEADADDGLRQLTAEARLDYQDLQRLEERIRRHDDAILPPAHARIEAALAAWRSSSGSLTQVLEARRAILDLHLSRLALQARAAQRRIRLDYLGAYQVPMQEHAHG